MGSRRVLWRVESSAPRTGTLLAQILVLPPGKNSGIWTLTRSEGPPARLPSRFCSAQPKTHTPPPSPGHHPLSPPEPLRTHPHPPGLLLVSRGRYFGRQRVQMSTPSPNHQGHHMKASQVNMAATTTTTATATATATATTTKTKPAAKAGANANPKQKTQMHRRSRTGGFHLYRDAFLIWKY